MGYFSKIEEIFTCCPKDPNLQIQVGNFSEDPSVYYFVVQMLLQAHLQLAVTG